MFSLFDFSALLRFQGAYAQHSLVNASTIELASPIAHFQRERQPGARMGACSIMGSFWGTVVRAEIFSLTQEQYTQYCLRKKILVHAIVPPNDHIIDARPSSPQSATLFEGAL